MAVAVVSHARRRRHDSGGSGGVCTYSLEFARGGGIDEAVVAEGENLAVGEGDAFGAERDGGAVDDGEEGGGWDGGGGDGGAVQREDGDGFLCRARGGAGFVGGEEAGLGWRWGGGHVGEENKQDGATRKGRGVK